jgi:excisionase family DNA binding protein
MANDKGNEEAAGPDAKCEDGAQLSELCPILTVEELAAFLRLNRKTVYEAVARGAIPGVRRIGATYRISRDAVMQWLSRSPGGVGSRRRPSP